MSFKLGSFVPSSSEMRGKRPRRLSEAERRRAIYSKPVPKRCKAIGCKVVLATESEKALGFCGVHYSGHSNPSCADRHCSGYNVSAFLFDTMPEIFDSSRPENYR